jgi:hypothetical protein
VSSLASVPPHRLFATRRAVGDGSSSRRLGSKGPRKQVQWEGDREIEDEEGGEEDAQPEGDEAAHDEQLWKSISAREHRHAPSAGAATGSRVQFAQPVRHQQQQQQQQPTSTHKQKNVVENDEGQEDAPPQQPQPYKAYRPYSEPRSDSILPPSSAAAAASSSASAPSSGGWGAGIAKPKYTSSRQTPAQLAWKKAERGEADGGAAEGGWS